MWNTNSKDTKIVGYEKGYNLKIKNYCTTTTNVSENRTPITEEKRIEIEQELNKAIEKHNGKYLLESLDIYRNVLNMIGEPNEETIEPYSFALLNIGQILIMYGYMDRDQKKVEEALDICKKLLMISPFEPQAHWNSFRCYAYLKDIEKAFAHLTIYEQQAPENLVKEVLQDIVPFVYTLGISLYRDKGSKGNKAADDCMRKVLEIDPNHVDALYSLGYANLESCSKQKGLEALEKCLSINNDYWQAHIRLGDMYKQSGDVENSKKHYENIERLKPEEPYYSAALYELGLIQMQRGEMKKSEKYFKKSLEANPDQPFTQANLANILSNLGKYEDAMKLLIECSEKLNKPALYIAIATLAAKIEKFDIAKDYLEKGAIKNQNYGGMEEFLRILAGTEIVHSGEKYEDALTCFEMGDNIAQLLHEIQPSIKTIFYFNYAKLLERLEKFEEAKENYMKVTEIKDVPDSDPLPLLARYAVGQMYINKGDNVEEGLDFLKEALQIYESKGGEASEMKPVEIRSSLNVPGSQNVAGLLYEKIGVAHSLRGEQELSIQNLEKSLEYNKNNPVVVANLANCYLTQNKVDQAISMLQECLQDHSHFAPLHSTLCVAFSKLKNWERSAHHGEMALGLDLSFQPEMVCQVLSLAFRELGDDKKAKEYEDKALTFVNQK